MREIKFRSWDNTKKHYVDSRNLIITEDAVFEDWRAQEDGICGDLILEQFTGLRDKNGKEIYEGDILGGACGLVVHWCDECHGWQLTYPGEGCFACSGDVMLKEYTQEEIEVIGNIHENPELL